VAALNQPTLIQLGEPAVLVVAVTTQPPLPDNVEDLAERRTKALLGVDTASTVVEVAEVLGDADGPVEIAKTLGSAA